MKDRQMCRRRVHGSGRMIGGEACGNWAKPGTTLCHVHTPKPAEDLKGRNANVRPSTAATLETTYYATLTWAEDTGPVVQVPYQKTLGVIQKVSASLRGDDTPLKDATMTLRGVLLKKDGSLGVRTWDCRWRDADRLLPDEDKAEVRRLLAEQRSLHQ